MKIEYVASPLEQLSKEETLVSVEIKPEAPFNGFSGACLQFAVKTKALKHEVLERVKWKVFQETGTDIEKTGGEFIERSAL